MLFGINDNKWLAYQFDNAVLIFGTWVQNRLDARDSNGKPKYSARQALGLPTEKRPINVMQLASLPGVRVK